MDFLDKYEEGEIIELINQSKNCREVLMKMGVSPNGGANTVRLSQYIKDHNILTNFDRRHYSDDEVFCENSIVAPKIVKNRYKKMCIKPYQCEICGLGPEWNGKPLELTFDHKDGNNTNNKLENLRWLCPNCDRQQSTFCSKNHANPKKTCLCCGAQLSSNKSRTGYCWDCWSVLSPEEKNHIIPREKRTTIVCPICGGKKKPKSKLCKACREKQNSVEKIKIKEEKYNITREKLKEMVRTKSFSQIGKEYGVTSNAVSKWCKAYNFPSKMKDIQKYSDEEWEKL